MSQQQSEASARRAAADPLAAILSGPGHGSEGAGSGSSGVRGMAARDAWVRMTQREGPRIRGPSRW
eukprot:9194422-Lingulodinium_polyedra.AAC.1